jgi:hypothetical protein
MARCAQRCAIDRVASTLTCRVPSGSASTLSGKRFAAPGRGKGWLGQGVLEGWREGWGEKLTVDDYLRSLQQHISQKTTDPTGD